MSAQVTATGIRDGDPTVLHALIERRGSAVVAYCERACAPSLAVDAAADAFARFREAVQTAEAPAELDPEVALLDATRRAAADHAPRPGAGPATGLARLLGEDEDGPRGLERVPELLAGRATGELSPADAAILDMLLATSPVARAIAERFIAAEQAYRNAARRRLPAPLAAQIAGTIVGDGDGDGGGAVNGHASVADEEDMDVEMAPGALTAEWAALAEDPVAPLPPIAAAAALAPVAAARPPAVAPAPVPARPSRPPAPQARGWLPGRRSLIPAGALVGVATVGAMIAAGVFGGNRPSPVVDTGIVKARAMETVPEGEAASVVADLRAAAAKAQAQRAAERRPAVLAEAGSVEGSADSRSAPAGGGGQQPATSGPTAQPAIPSAPSGSPPAAPAPAPARREPSDARPDEPSGEPPSREAQPDPPADDPLTGAAGGAGAAVTPGSTPTP